MGSQHAAVAMDMENAYGRISWSACIEGVNQLYPGISKLWSALWTESGGIAWQKVENHWKSTQVLRADGKDPD